PPGDVGPRDAVPARPRHHGDRQRAGLGPRSVGQGGRLLGEVGRRRDRQALTRGVHATTPRPGRRLAADLPQGLPAVGGVAENFASLLEAAARRAPGKAALVWDGGSLAWAGLDRRAGGFARSLVERGVKAGDRIALFIGNRWPLVVALLGGLKLG